MAPVLTTFYFTKYLEKINRTTKARHKKKHSITPKREYVGEVVAMFM